MAATEPESGDEALRAVDPVRSKKPVPEIAAVPGSAGAEPPVGVAACNLTSGPASVAEPQGVAVVAGKRNSGTEAATTGDVPLADAGRVANNLSTVAGPKGGSSAGGIPKADDIPDKSAMGPRASSAPAVVRGEPPNVGHAEGQTGEFLFVGAATTGRDYRAAQDQALPSTTAHQ